MKFVKFVKGIDIFLVSFKVLVSLRFMKRKIVSFVETTVSFHKTEVSLMKLKFLLMKLWFLSIKSQFLWVGPVAFFTDAFFSNCVFLSKSVFENATEIKRFRKKRYWIKTHLEKTQLKENATEFIPKAFFVKYYRLFRFKSVFFSIAFFHQMRFLLQLRFMCTSMFNELNQKRLFSKTFSISKTFSDSKISTFFYYTRSNVHSCAA